PFWVIYLYLRDGFQEKLLQGLAAPAIGYFGWVTIRACVERMGSRVLLCERGFIYHHRGGVTVFPWAEVTRVSHDDPAATPGRSGFPRVKKASEFTVFR